MVTYFLEPTIVVTKLSAQPLRTESTQGKVGHHNVTRIVR